MKVALLLDNSDRMSQLAALYPLRDATEVFLDTLGPEHEVALFTIARNLQRRVDFTTDREELKASAEEIFLDSGAGTPLLDGIRETWERHYDGEETLPVMVLMLTDGPENSRNYSDTAYAEFVETLIVDGVMVNVLQLSGGSRGSSASSSVHAGVRPQHRRHHGRRVRDLLRRDRHGGVDAKVRGTSERPLRGSVEALPRAVRAVGSARRADLRGRAPGRQHPSLRRPPRGGAVGAPRRFNSKIALRGRWN